MFYGSQVWDPILIVAQIVTIQCLFYISYGLLLWILVGPYASGHLTLEHFFGAGWLGIHSFVAWMAILANICNALPASLSIVLVVERAKKCLDFSATLYILHLVGASICSGFPKSAAWWVSNGVAFALTAVLSEWLCLRRELRDIPIGGLGKKRSGTPQGAELLPLNSLPTQPANSSVGTSQKGSSLLSRITASIGAGNPG